MRVWVNLVESARDDTARKRRSIDNRSVRTSPPYANIRRDPLLRGPPRDKIHIVGESRPSTTLWPFRSPRPTFVRHGLFIRVLTLCMYVTVHNTRAREQKFGERNHFRYHPTIDIPSRSIPVRAARKSTKILLEQIKLSLSHCHPGKRQKEMFYKRWKINAPFVAQF